MHMYVPIMRTQNKTDTDINEYMAWPLVVEPRIGSN
jgi:hypothetical protein